MTDELAYSTDNFPSVIQNDGTVKTLSDAQAWIKENNEALQKELNATGAILFRGFPVNDAQSYDDFFSSFGYETFTYKESLSNAVRINHTKRVFTANEAPKDVEIFLHNEMAQTPIYPNIISLFCEAAAEKGGATSACRSDWIYEELHNSHPQETDKLEELGVKYTTHMPADDSPESAQGRSWKSTLGSETKAEAETKLSELGYSWQWNEDGSLSVQSGKLNAINTLEDGRKVCFNQMIAAYLGWKGVKENPNSALCYGDGSGFSREFLNTMSEIAYDITFDIEWQDGDVALVYNHLVMHGRRPYSGERKRKVFVVLGI
jgi:alpha-ketoglutarate-dependent taurine dioxygenase